MEIKTILNFRWAVHKYMGKGKWDEEVTFFTEKVELKHPLNISENNSLDIGSYSYFVYYVNKELKKKCIEDNIYLEYYVVVRNWKELQNKFDELEFIKTDTVRYLETIK